MLLSMTGFGKASVEALHKKFTVEIKSLNSKQLDMNARVPSALRSLELELRNIAAQKLERGKVEMTVTVETLAGAATQVQLNKSALAAYKKQIEQAVDFLQIPEPSDWMTLLMRFPDVVSSDSDDDAENPELKNAVCRAVSEAVDGLMAHRRAEGKRLEEFFAVRIQAISELLKEIAPFEAERLVRIRERIEEGLARIPVAEIDKGRLEQEMIFYIEKLDINEERQRLSQHLNYFIETMNGTHGQGKKLGFIAQEMGREINTLGSKSNQADMQRIVVKMKDILEQIKEQVLNVM